MLGDAVEDAEPEPEPEPGPLFALVEGLLPMVFFLAKSRVLHKQPIDMARERWRGCVGEDASARAQRRVGFGLYIHGSGSRRGEIHRTSGWWWGGMRKVSSQVKTRTLSLRYCT